MTLDDAQARAMTSLFLLYLTFGSECYHDSQKHVIVSESGYTMSLF